MSCLYAVAGCGLAGWLCIEKTYLHRCPRVNGAVSLVVTTGSSSVDVVDVVDVVDDIDVVDVCNLH